MIGNDVVDLADPEVAGGERHPRFDARVFAPEERIRLGASADRERLRWMLWSAKEAAYKALRRSDPALVFAPSRFVVRLGRDLVGKVVHGARALAVRVELADDRVHAIAGSGLCHAVAALPPGGGPGEPGRAARRLALRLAEDRLGAPGGALRVVTRDRVPTLRRGDDPRGWALSLSHHGRFVAAALARSESAPVPGRPA